MPSNPLYASVAALLNSLIEFIDKEISSKNSKFVLLLNSETVPPHILPRLIEESKVSSKGYFEHYYLLQKECCEVFNTKISDFPTVASIMSYLSLREK